MDRNREQRSARRNRWWVIVLMAAGLLPAAIWLRERPTQLLARHWSEQLATTPDALVPVQLAQLAELGEAGMPVIVGALAHQRPSIAEAAAGTLHRQLDQWQRLPVRDSSPRVGQLARELAARVEEWPPGPRGVAGDLARRIVRWPSTSDATGKAQRILDCERVLRASSWVAQDPAKAANVADDRMPRESIQQPFDTARGGSGDAVELTASLASGQPPADPATETPPSPRIVLGTTVGEHRPAGQPSLLDRWPVIAELPKSDVEAGQHDDLLAMTVPSFVDTADQAQAPRPAADVDVDPHRSPHGAVPEPRRVWDPDATPDGDVRRLLHDHDVADRHGWETALRQRGFGPAEIAVARMVASPDVATRRQLAQALSRWPVNPSRWLIVLSHDSDPEVRRAVISQMATAQDPALYRRLLEMEQVEADESVRRQLAQWRKAASGLRP